jgi:acetyl esterase/lipase
MDRRRWFSLLLLGLLVPTLACCQPQTPTATQPADLEILRDVVYATVDGQNLHLDLVWAKAPAAQPRPLVLYIHGGAWRAGSYRLNPHHYTLAQQGFVVASVQYRLTPKWTFPAQIHDCKGALRYLRAKAAQYNFNPARVGVWGGSAGGHLAALMGTSGGVAELEGEVGGNLAQSSAVQCVVDLFGPSDMTTMIADRGARIWMDPNTGLTPEEALLGGQTEERLEVAKAASPVTFVDPQDPPFLIIHGEDDKIVPLRQSERLAEALAKAGVEHTFVRVKKMGHGLSHDSQPTLQQLQTQMQAFFARHLQGE